MIGWDNSHVHLQASVKFLGLPKLTSEFYKPLWVRGGVSWRKQDRRPATLTFYWLESVSSDWSLRLLQGESSPSARDLLLTLHRRNLSEGMAAARHVAICPPMDTCLSLIEEAVKQEECSQPIPHLPCSPAKGNPGGSKACQEKLDCERAKEKHTLMSSLGLVRTDLFPRIQALMEWRRRMRRRRQRQCKLGSSSAEHPSSAVTVSLPICNPANTGLKEPEKKINVASAEATLILEKKVRKKPENIPACVPQNDRSTRRKGVKPDVATASNGRRSVKTGDRVTTPSKSTAKTEVAHNKRPPSAKAKLGKNPMQRLDKTKKRSRETRGVLNAPPAMDQEKHPRKRAPPLKHLDSNFVLDSPQPAGEATAVKTKEKKTVDGFLIPSTSQARELTPRRVLRARGPPIIPPVTRSNQKRHRVTKSAVPEATNTRPKRTKTSLHNPRCTMPDSASRAQCKQLRKPRSQTAKVLKASHTCVQCEASYEDCDTLIMHRLRHVKGKQWPCPFCCKKFLRLRNVRRHIRTHEPKLYKCKNCIVAGI